MFNFNTNTIDSILKDFTVKISQLHAISARKREDAAFQEDMIKTAIELRDESLLEAERAAIIAHRIEALVG